MTACMVFSKIHDLAAFTNEEKVPLLPTEYQTGKGPERFGEETNLWPLSGIEPRLRGRLIVEQT